MKGIGLRKTTSFNIVWRALGPTFVVTYLEFSDNCGFIKEAIKLYRLKQQADSYRKRKFDKQVEDTVFW